MPSTTLIMIMTSRDKVSLGTLPNPTTAVLCWREEGREREREMETEEGKKKDKAIQGKRYKKVTIQEKVDQRDKYLSFSPCLIPSVNVCLIFVSSNDNVHGCTIQQCRVIEQSTSKTAWYSAIEKIYGFTIWEYDVGFLRLR